MQMSRAFDSIRRLVGVVAASHTGSACGLGLWARLELLIYSIRRLVRVVAASHARLLQHQTLPQARLIISLSAMVDIKLISQLATCCSFIRQKKLHGQCIPTYSMLS